ncbi:galactitol-1-phosphate 5-dehydrogenase [Sodalis ligni]|uniref:galactitol-1-phosphate 5-dehydrogenase n=1 Tax=Sodalis ligni TaxID=2697027 RepID=UPI00193EF655|nr:galactitol-1-phosphate 5-dehydrogenase [Sodalis ligni]QWA09277.1 galactitol-1-phosphate 5-dehydrogenase [Sodalis ligni]
MKVVALTQVGHLALQERDKPAPRPGEVLMKVMAAGICGSDIPRAFQTGTPAFPRVLGHEFSGRIETVGPGVNPALSGRKAAVFPIIPCGQCEFCQDHVYPRCLNYSSYGSRRDGGFSEYVTVPEFNLVLFDDTVGYTDAAMLEPATIGMHVLRSARLDLNDSVAIFGAGTIGLLTARWARLYGAGKIMLIDTDPDKVSFCRTLGFQHVLLAGESDPVEWVRQLTGGFGAHVTIEGSGSASGLSQALMACRTFGKVVLLGNPHGDMALARETYDRFMRKEAEIIGIYNSAYKRMPHDEWADAALAISSGKLPVSDLISRQVDISQLADLFDTIRNRREFICKGMMVAEE